MSARKIVRILGVALLILVTGSLGRGLGSKAEAKAIEARVSAAATSSGADEIVIVEPGQVLDDQLARHAFVVLRRADGRVPRAYVWDEPLGCPDSRSE